jgi:hypothetical protein
MLKNGESIPITCYYMSALTYQIENWTWTKADYQSVAEHVTHECTAQVNLKMAHNSLQTKQKSISFQI